MNLELESLRQQRLQHHPALLVTGSGRRFGMDVVAIAVQPARRSDDLEVSHIIRPPEAGLQRRIREFNDSGPRCIPLAAGLCKTIDLTEATSNAGCCAPAPVATSSTAVAASG